MDLEDMSSEELTELQDAVRAEQDRRYQTENIPRQIEAMLQQALEAGVSRDRLETAVDAALSTDETEDGGDDPPSDTE